MEQKNDSGVQKEQIPDPDAVRLHLQSPTMSRGIVIHVCNDQKDDTRFSTYTHTHTYIQRNKAKLHASLLEAERMKDVVRLDPSGSPITNCDDVRPSRRVRVRRAPGGGWPPIISPPAPDSLSIMSWYCVSTSASKVLSRPSANAQTKWRPRDAHFKRIASAV